MTFTRLHLAGALWRSPRGGVHLAGRIFEGTHMIGDEVVAERLRAITTTAELASQLARWNGFFAVAVETPSGALAAVDRVRSIPLFYAQHGPTLMVSDDAEWIRYRIDEQERDPQAVQEFLLTGYVTGHDTLFRRMRQLQAGELLRAGTIHGSQTTETVRYTQFLRSERERSHANLLRDLNAATEAAIDRLITVADGRPIVIPLSGGLDSRLIAVELATRRYEDLQAFTYGRHGNAEAAISRAVAQSLGIPWHFVEYSTEEWRRWSRTHEFLKYLNVGHLHSSVPHIQDWPAVRELTRLGVIAQGSVITPGHTGDFTAGGHTLREFVGAESVTAERLAEAVRQRHYRLWPASKNRSTRRMLVDRILDRLGLAGDACMSGHHAIAAHDTWNWQERQAKFIVNSVRAYEQWGHTWWLPLWDSELVDFWETVPLPWRLGKRLHQEHVAARYDEAANTSAVAASSGKPLHKRLTRLAVEVATLPPLIRLARAVAHWYRRRTEYESHPLAWYGIVDRLTFRRLYSGGSEDINSFLAEALMQRRPEGSSHHGQRRRL